MSDVALDRGLYFPSPITDWYRERPFKVAFAVSVVIHAALIALIPGFRSIPIEAPRVMEVEIAPKEAIPIPRIQEPVVPPKIVEPKIEPAPDPVLRQRQPEPVPEPVVRQPQPEPLPDPVLRQPQPEPPPPPRAEIIRAPRAEPRPEFVVPKPDLRPEPKAEPKLETRPEPKIEPRPEPPPVVRAEPRLEPRPLPREAPPLVATELSPPVVVQQPQPSTPKRDEAHEKRLLVTYGQSISKEIKRYQKYPPLAQRRSWEGTAEVLLQIAADGKVTGITLGKSSGHDILDQEALDMVRRASPLPQAPPDLRGFALVVSVPIVFRLQNS